MTSHSSALSLLQELFELKDYAKVVEGCLQLVERDPNSHETWFLRSRALVELLRKDEALHDIITACKLEPKNVEYAFFYFHIRIMREEPSFIPNYINHKFFDFDQKGREKMISYVRDAIECGLFSKLQLSNEVLAALLPAL